MVLLDFILCQPCAARNCKCDRIWKLPAHRSAQNNNGL